MKIKVTIAVFVAAFLGLLLLIYANSSSSSCNAYPQMISTNANSEEPLVTSKGEDKDIDIGAAKPAEEYITSDSIFEICKPAPLSDLSEQIIKKNFFIVSYNKNTKIPNWVAWHLTAEQTDGPYKRLSNFHEDEEVPTPRATLSDYRGSGWSRGHMCPAGDNKWNEKAMYDSFSLINVCPQNSSLNSGLWNSIEMDCRKWARQYGDIYIVCGPVLMRGNHETIGENEVIVPEAFFKVVLCLNGKAKAFGFIVRNTEGNKKRDLYYNSVDQVERITGIDFFPALPDDIEDEVEAKMDMELWK